MNKKKIIIAVLVFGFLLVLGAAVAPAATAVAISNKRERPQMGNKIDSCVAFVESSVHERRTRWDFFSLCFFYQL